jgi:hypothetical protein
VAAVVNLPTVLAALSAGNQPASLIDGDFNALKAAIAELNTFSNYLVDTGVANAYIVTLNAGTTGALQDGLQIQVKITNANTGASTLNYNSTGAIAITYLNGSALTNGQLPAAGIVSLIYSASANAWQLVAPTMSQTTGTFTLTATAGWTTTPTATVKYAQQGNLVCLDIPGSLSGTSNSTAATASGIPSALQPTGNKILNGVRMIDNGGSDAWGLVEIGPTPGAGLVSFFKNPNGDNWTNSGTKVIDSGVLNYSLL